MSQRHLLENIIWKALTGPHMRFTVGTTKARRYATGFSPIAGFLTVDNPDFGALAPYCVPGEQLYCDGWSGPVPASWQIHAESTMVKMAWDAPLPIEDPTIGAARLRTEHADMALELAQRMQPGPFGRRTPELGDPSSAVRRLILVFWRSEIVALQRVAQVKRRSYVVSRIVIEA